MMCDDCDDCDDECACLAYVAVQSEAATRRVRGRKGGGLASHTQRRDIYEVSVPQNFLKQISVAISLPY